MLARLAMLVLLSPALASTSSLGTHVARVEAKVDCDRDLRAGRYYLSHSNLIAALGSFGFVVKQCRTNSNSEEALARLTIIYLAIGIYSEAQAAVALLEHEFPNGQWTIVAQGALRSAGLEPSEDEKSWVFHAFKYPIERL
jgi:outer membrane protein assembly factor BamD